MVFALFCMRLQWLALTSSAGSVWWRRRRPVSSLVQEREGRGSARTRHHTVTSQPGLACWTPDPHTQGGAAVVRLLSSVIMYYVLLLNVWLYWTDQLDKCCGPKKPGTSRTLLKAPTRNIKAEPESGWESFAFNKSTDPVWTVPSLKYKTSYIIWFPAISWCCGWILDCIKRHKFSLSMTEIQSEFWYK